MGDLSTVTVAGALGVIEKVIGTRPLPELWPNVDTTEEHGLELVWYHPGGKIRVWWKNDIPHDLWCRVEKRGDEPQEQNFSDVSLLAYLINSLVRPPKDSHASA